jgi:hypothetical protein
VFGTFLDSTIQNFSKVLLYPLQPSTETQLPPTILSLLYNARGPHKVISSHLAILFRDKLDHKEPYEPALPAHFRVSEFTPDVLINSEFYRTTHYSRSSGRHSRYSDLATALRTELFSFDCRQKHNILLVSRRPHWFQVTTSVPEFLRPGVKQPTREADLSPPYCKLHSSMPCTRTALPLPSPNSP